MAVKPVDAFLSMMRQDPAILTEADQALASAPEPFAALVGLAARHGLDVTAVDLQAALTSRDGLELPNSELAKVAGGAEDEGPAHRLGRTAALESWASFVARARR